MSRNQEISPYQPAMKQRLAYEQAEFACIRILSEVGDLNGRLQRVTGILLATAGVSRVYVFENQDDPESGMCMKQICESCAEGIEPQIDNPHFRHFPYKDGAASLLAQLQARKPYSCGVSKLEGPEREILEAQHILSILIVPIFGGDSFWGFIGFDDCETPREWQDVDVRILETVADAVGMAVSRRQRWQELERRVAFERLVAVACSRLALADAETMDDSLIRSLENKYGLS